MKRILALFGFAVILVILATSLAVAQSSGNFSAAITNAACTLNTTTGELTGPETYSLSAPIKVSNGNGLALLITPSMVTGLYTKTKIDSLISTASAAVGIQVCLTVTNQDGSSDAGVTVFPYKEDAEGNRTSCVVYDQRFQQISSGLFTQIASCVPVASATACTTTDDCSPVEGSEVFCNNPTGGELAGFCNSFPSSCNFDMILSTLGARSFNFIITLPGGSYNINAEWSLFGVKTTGASDTAACVGPGTLTVVQTKVFNNSGVIIIQ